MSSSIVAPSSFSASKVTLSPLKLLESGGKQAYVNYDGRPLVMQVGSLETSFGLSVYDKATPPKYTVDLKLQGYDDAVNSPKVAAVYNAMSALDEHLIQQAVKNSRQWFKADMNLDMARMLYTPSVRFAKDADGNVKPYPPTLKIQLRQRDGKFETAVYDDKKRPLTDIPLEDVLVKKAFLTVLIQCTGVWIAGGKFGLSWKAIQIRADKVPDSIRGFAFLDDGEAEEDAPAAKLVGKPATKVAPAKPAPANQFELLDEEEEVDDDEALAAPAAAPAKAPVAQPMDEDANGEAAEDVPPAAVPLKKTVTKKVIVKNAAAGAKK
jgi:hypothetical protein